MLKEVVAVLETLGVPWFTWLRAWLRILPSATLVPALGARFLPTQSRAVLGLALAGLMLPALSASPGMAAGTFSTLGARVLLEEVALGLPVALSAAAALWGVSQAGALFDDLRGASAAQMNLVSDANSPFGTLLSLFASLCFLELGGVEQVTTALAAADLSVGVRSWWSTIHALNAGIYFAFSLAAPLIVVSLLQDVAWGLSARAAQPASVQGLIAPLRGLVLLAAFALLLRNALRFIVEHLASTS